MHEHDSISVPATAGRRGLSRRDLLRRAAWLTAGVPAVLLLEACGQTAPAPPTSAPAKPTTAAAAPPPAAASSPAAGASPVGCLVAVCGWQSGRSSQPGRRCQAGPGRAGPTGPSGGQATMAIFGTPGSSLLGNFTSTNYGVTLAQCQFEAMFGYDEKLQMTAEAGREVGAFAGR